MSSTRNLLSALAFASSLAVSNDTLADGPEPDRQKRSGRINSPIILCDTLEQSKELYQRLVHRREGTKEVLVSINNKAGSRACLPVNNVEISDAWEVERIETNGTEGYHMEFKFENGEKVYTQYAWKVRPKDGFDENYQEREH